MKVESENGDGPMKSEGILPLLNRPVGISLVKSLP